MTIVAFFILVALAIAVMPMVIPYLLVVYTAVNGISSRHFMDNLKVSIGSVNIFFPDLLYAATVTLAVVGLVRLVSRGRLRSYTPLSKAALFLTIAYFLFFCTKLVSGYFAGQPADTLVRRFALDTQCLYLFIPLLFLKTEATLKRLLYFAIAATLVFPVIQPFLYGSADQVALEIGQHGTLRLGYGNGNLLLMLGVFAFFVWERRLYLSALPLAGIAMLAQRSAFVALALVVALLAFKKKKGLKFLSLVAIAGMLFVGTLLLIQATSSVPVATKAADRVAQTFVDTGTTRARVESIPLLLSAFSKHPWVGYSYDALHGLERTEVHTGLAAGAVSFDMLHPHNFVLSSLVRTGIVGTLLLFSIIGVILLASLRLVRQQEIRRQGMYLFSTALFFVIFGLMNTSFVSAGYVFWMLAGIILWYGNNPSIIGAVAEAPKTDQSSQKPLRILQPARQNRGAP